MVLFYIKVYNYYLKLVIDCSLDLKVGYIEGRINKIKFINQEGVKYTTKG